jgi:hypothetical protein
MLISPLNLASFLLVQQRKNEIYSKIGRFVVSDRAFKAQEVDTFVCSSIDKFEAFEERLATAIGEAELRTHLGIKEIVEEWRQLEYIVTRRFDRIRAESEAAIGAMQKMRVRLHLGRLEAVDFFERLKESLYRIEGRLKLLESHLAGDAARTLNQISKSCSQLRRCCI